LLAFERQISRSVNRKLRHPSPATRPARRTVVLFGY
jgi:hypothetical protein